MNFPLRLLVSDIDGTLVREDKTLSEAVVTAARRLIAAGVQMTLISARPPSGVLWIARKLELTLPIGAFNGGTIVTPDGEVLFAVRLEPDAASQALRLIDRPGVTPWIFSEGCWYAARPDGKHDLSERLSANQEPHFRADLTCLIGAADKIVAVCDDHAMLAEMEGEVARSLGQAATVARSQPYYLDITAPAANKGDGIIALAAAAGVPLANVAAIGDQRNDIAMFERAGLSVAMRQGPETVRARATYVTGSNAEDGVAQAIDDILLPMIQSV
jgi:Cof subfamily protein (haloacid dehalogenase superfamily)